MFAKTCIFLEISRQKTEHADPSRTNAKPTKNKRFLPVGKITSHTYTKPQNKEQLTNNNNIYLYLSLSCCAVLASLLLNIIKRYVPIAT